MHGDKRTKPQANCGTSRSNTHKHTDILTYKRQTALIGKYIIKYNTYNNINAVQNE